MIIPFYQVDAFTDRAFGGNPAAVCPLNSWLPDATLQAIAAENNLAETAFFGPDPAGEGLRIRWFTPTVEVDICGHATLASGAVVLRHRHPEWDRVVFQSRSGPLSVARRGDRLALDFPAVRPVLEPVDAAVAAAAGGQPVASFRTRDVVLIYETAEEVRALAPDLARLTELGVCLGVTALGTGRDNDVDFVSRNFAPTVGIPEDPVTGSAHCWLTPYWAERLGRKTLTARQVSARSGDLWLELLGDRVSIEGQAVLVIEGSLHL